MNKITLLLFGIGSFISNINADMCNYEKMGEQFRKTAKNNEDGDAIQTTWKSFIPHIKKAENERYAGLNPPHGQEKDLKDSLKKKYLDVVINFVGAGILDKIMMGDTNKCNEDQVKKVQHFVDELKKLPQDGKTHQETEQQIARLCDEFIQDPDTRDHDNSSVSHQHISVGIIVIIIGMLVL